MENLKKLIPHFLLMGGFFFLVGVFFWKMLFTDGTPFYFDLYSYIYPNIKFLTESIHGGEIPLWNPYLKTGVPFLADPAVGLFYPLHFPFFLWNFPQALKIFLFIHYALALVNCFYCGRQYGLSREGALLSAMAFAFSGYFISMANVFTKLRGLVWVPLFFGLAKKAREEEGVKYKFLSGGVLALIVLGGHFYCAYFLCFFWILENLITFLHKKSLPWKGMVLVLLSGIGLSACQWVPSVKFLSESERRENLDSWSQKKWHLSPKRLAELAFPAPGAPLTPKEEILAGKKEWAPSLYMGFIVLLLALGALWKLSLKKNGFWAAMLLLSILLSLGHHTPLWGFFQGVLPLLDKLRFPEKIFFWATFALALLGGMGYDHFFRPGPPGKRILLFFLPGIALEFLLLNPTESLLLSQTSLWPWLRFGLIGGIFLVLFHYRFKVTWTSLFLLGLIFGDLHSINFSVLPLGPSRLYTTSPEVLKKLPPPILGKRRVALLSVPEPEISPSERDLVFWTQEKSREKLEGNVLMTFGHEALIGLAPATLGRYNTFFTHFYKDGSSFHDLMDCEYLLGPRHPPAWMGEKYQVHCTLGRAVWYRRKVPLPRARLYYSVEKVGTFEGTLRKAKNADLLSLLLIEDPSAKPGRIEFKRGKEDKVEILSYHLNRLTLRVKVEHPCYLLFLDGYAKGWQARIQDGPDLPCRAGNILFRGISLPQGRYELILDYNPPGLFLGWLIVGIALALMGGVILWKPGWSHLRLQR